MENRTFKILMRQAKNLNATVAQLNETYRMAVVSALTGSISDYEKWKVQYAVLRNPCFPHDEAYLHITADTSLFPFNLSQYLRRNDIPPATLQRYINYINVSRTESYTMRLVYHHRNMTSDMIAAEFTNLQNKSTVGLFPYERAEIINRYATLAQHTSAPINIIETAAQHQSSKVRAAAASNPNIPKHLFLMLQEDETVPVRKALLTYHSTVKLLNSNLKNERATIRATVAKITSNPKHLHFLSTDHNVQVRKEVARNSATQPTDLNILCNDTHRVVRETARKNHNCPLEGQIAAALLR